MSFDIFCRVIDNYGDVGVCWRLARQLAARLRGQGRVRLWVDDLHSFARLAPAFAPQLSSWVESDVRPNTLPDQAAPLHGVHIHHWPQAEHDDVQPMDVVIEAFACDLPPAFRARMRAGRQRWLNLEYLSAQDWVQDCHGLPSLQGDGLTKHFFFPGFTVRTGGLLREPDLLARRDAWQRTPANRAALLQELGVAGDWIAGLMERGWRQVYVFCYPQAPLQALVQACKQMPTQIPTVLLAAPGTPTTEHDDVLVHRFDCPFVAQPQFDPLLWGSDLNLVRGEDSFVRAIWAARPFIWQPYAQAEDAHLHKLDAWLAHHPCPPEAAELMRAWNGTHSTGQHTAAQTHRISRQLATLLAPPAWQHWQDHARRYSARQAEHTDLVRQLLQFVRHPLLPQQAL